LPKVLSSCPRHLVPAAMKAAAILMVLATSVNAIELETGTWEAAVAGKSVFVKFQAPW